MSDDFSFLNVFLHPHTQPSPTRAPTTPVQTEVNAASSPVSVRPIPAHALKDLLESTVDRVSIGSIHVIGDLYFTKVGMVWPQIQESRILCWQ